MARDNFVDLTVDDSAEDTSTTETRSLRPQTENAQRQEARPALLQSESAPVAGVTPRPAEPVSGTPRSRSEPVIANPTARERRAAAQRAKIDKLTVQRTDSEMRKLIVNPISDVSDLQSCGK